MAAMDQDPSSKFAPPCTHDDHPNTSDTQGDDEDSFFARLKKKFEGLDEEDIFATDDDDDVFDFEDV